MGDVEHKRKKKPKKKKQENKSNGLAEPPRHESSSPYKDDARFRVAATRPQFKIGAKSRQEESKVVLDERFASVFTDPRFRVGDDGGDDNPAQSGVDKYGRRKKKTAPNLSASAQDELAAFYTVEESKGVLSAGDTKQTESMSSSQDLKGRTQGSDDDDDDDDDGRAGADKKADNGREAHDPEERIAYLTALSRGEIDSTSSSDELSSDEERHSSGESDGDESVDGSIRGTAGVLDPSARLEALEDVQITHQESRYLAVLNLEWNVVRAVDILAILSSFAPPGSVVSVRVYPSDFGNECMAKEEALGPRGIWRQEQEGQDSETMNAPPSEPDNPSEDEGDVDSGNDNDGAEGAHAAYDHFERGPQTSESDFDTEKLRAYEAAKLKYYFAVAEFATEEAVDAVYREVDGMEVGHSSACIDLRLIPPGEVESAVRGRKLRDESLLLPSNYSPPDFVVSALQQTAVKCTWEEGDPERESKLTRYGAWDGLTARDDLKAYLASDESDSDDSDVEGASNNNGKRSKLRQLFGLDNSDDDDTIGREANAQEEQSDSEEGSQDETTDKVITLLPGKRQLEEKIRTAVETSGVSSELTPWQKYLEKRKEKRREKRRTAREEKKALKQEEKEYRRSVVGEKSHDGTETDAFFLDNEEERCAGIDPSADSEFQASSRGDFNGDSKEDDSDDEKTKDYSMRDLLRVEKNKSKNLRGSRKRKEERITADVPGLNFEINAKDERFAALLEGDDERFGIDRTDPNFKDTPSMRVVLAEQRQRLMSKRKRKRTAEKATEKVGGGEPEKTSRDRSSLVDLAGRLKSNVKRRFGVKVEQGVN